MLFLCGQSFISGGEYALRSLILNLPKKETIYLICHNNLEIKKFFEIPNLVIIGCPYFHSLSHLRKKYGLSGYVLKILSTISFLIFFTWLTLKIKPKIIISNNFSEIPASLIAFIFKIPFLQYVHEIVQSNSKSYRAIKFFKKFIKKFIFVSNGSKEAVSSILALNKLTVAYNSVDLHEDAQPKVISLPPLKLLFIGMINPNKNPLRFLNWVRILSDKYQVSAKIIYHLYEENLLNECQNYAKKFKLDVEWIKNPDQKTLTSHIYGHHFLCSTSLYEAQPLTVLNAISTGTPIITSQNTGVPEIISDGYTGIIINDDTELNEKIHPYIQSDYYKRMSQNCLNESLKFSHKNRVKRFLEIINNI